MSWWITMVMVAVLGLFNEQASAEGFSKLSLKEPITNTLIEIPEGELLDSALHKFEKFKVNTPTSIIKVYSMENPENEPFTWERINEFDKSRKYGHLESKERLDGKTDGWIRYYSSTSDSGKEIVNCVSLIRGNGYALYVLETAVDKSGLVSPAIVKTTEFKPITNHRVNNDGKYGWKSWCVFIGILILALLLKPIQKRLSETFLVILSVIVLGGLFCGMYFYAKFSFGISIGVLILEGLLWVIILCANSWKDFWRILDNVLKNVGD